MLVVAIVAVGSVSAAENVTTDIDVPTEEIEIDDSVVEEFEIEDITEDADVDDNSGNIRSSDIHVNNGMTLDQIQGNISNAADGSTIYFDSGIYNNISLTLNKSNVIYSGYGATLNGNGADHVLILQDNLSNFTIQGFKINVNNNGSSAIRGSFIYNGNILNNELSNGENGINIFKSYDNITVEDNTIRNMTQDGISFANPITFSNITDLGRTHIIHNGIYDSGYGIFIGGNFNGEIDNNDIQRCTSGIEFLGKPDGSIGNINATISRNYIYDVYYGINMTNMTIHYLNIDTNWIFGHTANNLVINYLNLDFAGDYVLDVIDNSFYGSIYQSFVEDMCTDYDNVVNATIINDYDI